MRPPRGKSSVAAAALAGALLLGAAACSAEEPDGKGTPAPTGTAPVPGETGGTVELAPGVTVPETRAGRATSWVLEQLAAAEGPAAEEAAERFAQVFLDEVPADQVATVFAQVRAAGPFVVGGYAGTEDAAELLLTGPEDRFLLHVGTDAEGRMNLLFFAAAPPVPQITSLDDVESAVADLGIESSLLVADGRTCEPVRAREADVARPVGSIVKLYVLDAVRHAVAAGDLGWDDTVTVTDDLRSLPTGRLQDEPAGHEVSVREAAELMIAISDNTATDLLVDAVGRDAVEEAVVRLGHHDPALLTPLPTTREIFQLAFTDAALRERWSVADAGERAAILDGLPGGPVDVDPALTQDVVWPLDVDWFATAMDVCRAHAGLREGEEAEAVAEILALNPGLEVPAGWAYVGFKGGSMLGEMAGSWYLEDEAGQAYVVVVQLAATDPAAVPDAGWMSGVVGQAVEVLGEEA